MRDKVSISVSDLTGPHGMAKSHGETLYRRVSQALQDNRTVELCFSGLEVIHPAFIRPLARLWKDLPKEKIDTKLEVSSFSEPKLSETFWRLVRSYTPQEKQTPI